VRATGATDVLPPVEPRVRAAAARAAGDPALATDEEAFRAAAEDWRPWRTWACVLLRVDAEASGRG
jgi:3-methyladenine DNA glycosylase/8-oxoguanine DNA glycosylase